MLEMATKNSPKEIQQTITMEMEAMPAIVKKSNEDYEMMEQTVQTLHVGQLSMDAHIKMLIQKNGDIIN